MPTITKNLGETDRLVRLVFGLFIVGLSLLVTLPPLWQGLVWVVAAIMLLTAATGY
ncbi:MAG: DUF2892 domain-containing protein [Syntrophomonas sp.]|nr:DUF2892 domain-containing protein [Syntrophomonas sp.]